MSRYRTIREAEIASAKAKGEIAGFCFGVLFVVTITGVLALLLNIPLA